MEIILLHAHARTGRSMRPLAHLLQKHGHQTHIIDYRSRHAPLRVIADEVAAELRKKGLANGGPDLGFVTHSMGGVVLRSLPLALKDFQCGRSVCLGGPLNGSIVARKVGRWPVVRQVLGPALAEMSPEGVAMLPITPGPYGSIAGNVWTPFLPAGLILRLLAPGQASDSTVLVEETRGPGCVDLAQVAEVHTLLPNNKEVHRLVLRFLEHGAFA